MLPSALKSFGAVLVMSLLLLAAACGEDSPAADAPQEQSTTQTTQTTQASETTQTAEATLINVATTSNIIADWVSIVGQDRVSVFAMLPPNADPHTFQPGARDVARVADADVVLSIGLGLEEAWLTDLLTNTAKDESAIIELGEGEGIDALEFASGHAGEVELLEGLSHIVHEVAEGEISAEEGLEEVAELLAAMEAMEEHHEEEEEAGDEELPAMIEELLAMVQAGGLNPEEAIEELEHLTEEGEEGHEGHGHGLLDPHFWFDPLRVKEAVSSIAAKLSELDPEGAQVYQANASAYNQELDALHGWIQEEVAKLPADRRKLVTSHDSFQYFAERYGFEVVGAILPTNIEWEPTAQELAELVEAIEHEGVSAIFAEKSQSDRLGRRIAEETGAQLIGGLYTGSLGEADGEAGTYIDLMRYNVTTIIEALL